MKCIKLAHTLIFGTFASIGFSSSSYDVFCPKTSEINDLKKFDTKVSLKRNSYGLYEVSAYFSHDSRGSGTARILGLFFTESYNLNDRISNLTLIPAATLGVIGSHNGGADWSAEVVKINLKYDQDNPGNTKATLIMENPTGEYIGDILPESNFLQLSSYPCTRDNVIDDFIRNEIFRESEL